MLGSKPALALVIGLPLILFTTTLTLAMLLWRQWRLWRHRNLSGAVQAPGASPATCLLVTGGCLCACILVLVHDHPFLMPLLCMS